MSVRAKAIGYWISTVVIAFSLGSGGIAQVMRVPQVVHGIGRLGYPLHFIVLLGVWKVLGSLAILVPGGARLKEWAYAGMFFELSAAVVAEASGGGDVRLVVTPIVFTTVLVVSWALRRESRKLARPSNMPSNAKAEEPLPNLRREMT